MAQEYIQCNAPTKFQNKLHKTSRQSENNTLTRRGYWNQCKPAWAYSFLFVSEIFQNISSFLYVHYLLLTSRLPSFLTPRRNCWCYHLVNEHLILPVLPVNKAMKKCTFASKAFHTNLFRHLSKSISLFNRRLWCAIIRHSSSWKNIGRRSWTKYWFCISKRLPQNQWSYSNQYF